MRERKGKRMVILRKTIFGDANFHVRRDFILNKLRIMQSIEKSELKF